MKITVVHALPGVSSAFGQDFDGFTAAMDVIAQDHQVEWRNVHPANDDAAAQARDLTDADFVLVRSDWGWYPDRVAARALSSGRVPCGLIIAGSHRPPSVRQALRYDVVFYETPWYRQFVDDRLNAVEAFGVDGRVMFDQGLERDIDWIMVGRLAGFKRPLRLLEKSGVRVAVGDFASGPQAVKRQLIEAGVDLVDHVDQAALAALYNRSKRVLVPCELQGGGERAVIEGRACGCAVEVASDNPKLASLLDAPVRDHHDYADLLLQAIEETLAGRRTTRTQKRIGYTAMTAAILADKARRAPQTIRIRARDLRARRGQR